MAKSVHVVVSDDLDGSEGAETVSFGFDGLSYEIDLSEKNRAKLDKAFAPFLRHGRRVTQRRRPSATRTTGPRIDRASLRNWAKEQGLHVSDRGRISAEIMQKYEASH
ncbi:MAG TPA: Lsr2 family protein [Streptosporangiaceae bacterium]